MMLYQLSYVRISAEPTKDDNIPLRPASQMLGVRSVRGHGQARVHVPVGGACRPTRGGPETRGIGWNRPEPAGACRDVGHIVNGAERRGNHVSFFESTREGGQHLQGDWRSGSALPSHGRGHWFEPSIAHGGILGSLPRGRSSVGRASPCQGEGRRFESGRPLWERRLRRSSEAPFPLIWHTRWVGRVVRQRPAKPCTRVRIPYPPPPAQGADTGDWRSGSALP